MEFKLDGTAEEAIKQINEKHYALPFEADGRRLFKIGVNFSSETRNIEKWIVEWHQFYPHSVLYNFFGKVLNFCC